MSEELNGFDNGLGTSGAADWTGEASGQAKPVAKQATSVVRAGADNAVVIPPGLTIDTLEVQGSDLVIVLSDGTRLVVPDGAIIVPQLIVDGVPIPPANVAALLIGNEPEPAVIQTPSSGGNFAYDPGSIQSAFDLGDLLPYTELPRAEQVEREIIPGFLDREPTVVIETPDNPVGVENAIAIVSESGLPVRGNPSEPQGSDAASSSESASGTIRFASPDGVSAIFINDVQVTTVGQTFTSPLGTMSITSIDLAGGTIGFTYVLADNSVGGTSDPFFVVRVVDRDGDSATANLTVQIVDDGPAAANDAGAVPGGSHAAITGNVLANDLSGADDFATAGGVLGFSRGGTNAAPGATLQGQYGTLTLNADGSYSYVRSVNTPGGVQESFDYAVVDQDGSTSAATLVITIGDAPNSISLPSVGEATQVDEGGLPPRGGVNPGTGEIADDIANNNSDTSEQTGGTITFVSTDGVQSVTIEGVTITPGNLPQTVVNNAEGTLIVTGYTYDPVTGQGTITYTYTLGDNTSGDDTTVDIDIVVTDLDGDTAADTLVIAIVDDVPMALDDSASQGTENAAITVDVLANDVPGADGVADGAVAAVAGSLSGTGTLAYNGDGTFTYTPGSGEEG
ncbi:Ig-like domain-containing protein, partial [Aurantiacibacter luteus]|uniref:Ig-like domain-containing protein n=1 Tax=Aurantiacibacter luteus TaxID=1581420 RepID=UPI000AF59978